MSTTTLQIEKKKMLAPHLRFPGFDQQWEQNKLGSLGEFKGGGTPSTTNEDHWNGNIPWISSSDIYDGNLHEINIHRFLNEAAIKESATKIIPANSILLVSRVGVGKLAINKIELCTSQDFCNFIPNKCNSYFVGYFLISRKQILINFSQGTSIKGFTTGDIKTLPITLPTLPEQQKIASFLNAVDEKIQHLSRKNELLVKYKKGVMQQLFSSKLRFKDENGKEYPDWEEKKLGEVCKLNPKNSLLPSSFVYIDLESVVDGQLLKETRINLSEAPSRAQRLLSCEDILFQMVRPYQKNNLFFKKNGEYVASTGYAQLRAKESSMFLYQLIHTTDFVNKVIDRCTGTSYPAINSTDLSNIEISFPSLHEQQKIANFLSGIDGKIEQVNGELVKTQEFKKGLLQQMFV